MANITDTKIEVSESISDLIDNSIASSSIFNRYIDKKIVGKKIFAELYKKFISKGSRKGFYLADNTKEIGVLSQCQSLQALMLLATDYDLDFKDKNLNSKKVENISIRDIMDIIIEDVLVAILPDGVNLDEAIEKIKNGERTFYKFDASPYTETFTVEYSNIDTITWVITTFLLVLKHHASIHEICKWEDILVDVITYGLNYINSSFISSESEGTAENLTIGWNFTKGCEEPSLYYTFAICDCFIDFFETFKEYLEILQAERNEADDDIPVPDYLKKLKKTHAEEYEKMLARPDPGRNAEGKELTKFDEYHELVRIYNKINKCNDAITGTPYGELEEKCKKTAHEVWRLVKNGLSDNFYYNDLHKIVTESEIETSTTSDVLFNTVYIINILIEAGLDEDILLEQTKAEISGRKEDVVKAKSEYNDLLESCQLAIQRAFRTYEKLKKKSKEYIVDQFLVGFNETFDCHRDWIKDLRKLRMRVFSLTPMLIKTNTIISDYLIRYPQSTMKKYLGYILDNRYVEKGITKWIWETDGYFSASNYYYVSALKEFYTYHEKYEKEFFEIEEKNKKTIENIIKKHDEKSNESGEIRKLKDKLEDKEVEIAKLTAEKNAISRPIEDAVKIVVKQVLQESFTEVFTSFLSDAAVALDCTVPESYKPEKYSAFSEAVEQLSLAFISENIKENSFKKNMTSDANKEAARKLKKHIKKDFSRCLISYVGEVNNTEDNRSRFYRQDKEDK